MIARTELDSRGYPGDLIASRRKHRPGAGVALGVALIVAATVVVYLPVEVQAFIVWLAVSIFGCLVFAADRRTPRPSVGSPEFASGASPSGRVEPASGAGVQPGPALYDQDQPERHMR